MRTLSLSQARRMALGAQGLSKPPAGGRVGIRRLRRAMAHLGALQIDAVNAVARAHLLTLHARLGAFDPCLLDDAAYHRRELFEYWAHEAAYVPVELHPVLRPRMAAFPMGHRTRALLAGEPGYLDEVLEELAERGPLTASELNDPGERSGPWWGWSKGKVALERLFATGRVAVAERRNFTRVYDLAERVIPAEILALPTPEPLEADRALLLLAARCVGVGTVGDLADHFRIPTSRAQGVVRGLVADGELQEVAVKGWTEAAFALPDAVIPRHASGSALLCPFDPVVWNRPRTERLFGFRYRIEIYTPAEQRVHGYYVLPFLLGEHLGARVDVRADRTTRVLQVPGAFAEPDLAHSDVEVVEALVGALTDLAAWLELDAVVVGDRGDLAPALQRALPG